LIGQLSCKNCRMAGGRRNARGLKRSHGGRRVSARHANPPKQPHGKPNGPTQHNTTQHNTTHSRAFLQLDGVGVNAPDAAEARRQLALRLEADLWAGAGGDVEVRCVQCGVVCAWWLLPLVDGDRLMRWHGKRGPPKRARPVRPWCLSPSLASASRRRRPGGESTHEKTDPIPHTTWQAYSNPDGLAARLRRLPSYPAAAAQPVSYTHLRAHET